MKRYLTLIVSTLIVATAQDPFGDISSLKLAKAEDKADVPGTPAPLKQDQVLTCT